MELCSSWHVISSWHSKIVKPQFTISSITAQISKRTGHFEPRKLLFVNTTARALHIIIYSGPITQWPCDRGEPGSIGACSVEETNVSGEQIDYSRPWKPRMDQCEGATLLFGQAHLPLPPTRSTNRVIIYLFVARDAWPGSCAYSPSCCIIFYNKSRDVPLLFRRFRSSSMPAQSLHCKVLDAKCSRRWNLVRTNLIRVPRLSRAYDVTSVIKLTLRIHLSKRIPFRDRSRPSFAVETRLQSRNIFNVLNEH